MTVRFALFPALLNVVTFLFFHNSYAQTFSKVTGTGTEVTGNKDGGAVWADFDKDGDLDLLVNTNQNNTAGRTRLLSSNGAANPTFTDVTQTLANGLRNNLCERSVMWGDLNNDGNIDFIRNTYYRVEIYINRGTSSTPNYMFGVGTGMTPNYVFEQMNVDGCTYSYGGTAIGMNAEGMALIDYNNDGWLDIVLENGECGIDILENQKLNASSTVNIQLGDGLSNTQAEATGNGFFNHVSITGNTLGLPLTANNGDYMASGDYDGDGYVDFVVRKPTGTNNAGSHVLHWDLWHNNGDDTFTQNTTLPNAASTNAANGNKGGVMFCDFDLDGDLDLYWTDAGTNQVWLQTSTGTFTASAKPTIPGSPDIDGCACADVDGDGDMDMFLGNASGNSYLFINTTSGTNSVANLSFTRTDIAVNADAEGVNLVDYDGDGDYDIYVNVNGGANQIWENDLCDGGGCSFIEVFIEDCVDGSTSTRPVVGATIVIKDSGGNIISASQSGSTSAGHGAQNPPAIIFSLPDMTSDYIIDIVFPEKNGSVESYSYEFNAADIVDNSLVLTALNGTDGSSCDSFSVLPVELVSFKAVTLKNLISIEWTTASELNNHFFILEKSVNGTSWSQFGTVAGSGTSKAVNSYVYHDDKPEEGVNYYRLVQVDYDGTQTISNAIVAFYQTEDDLAVYPNPMQSKTTIYLGKQFTNTRVRASLKSLSGDLVWSKEVFAGASRLNLHFNYLSTGIYILEVENDRFKSFKRLIVE